MLENEEKNEAYCYIVAGILHQAEKDYKRAFKTYLRNPNNAIATGRMKEIERFCKSNWCELITDGMGEVFLKRLKEDCVKMKKGQRKNER